MLINIVERKTTDHSELSPAVAFERRTAEGHRPPKGNRDSGPLDRTRVKRRRRPSAPTRMHDVPGPDALRPSYAAKLPVRLHGRRQWLKRWTGQRRQRTRRVQTCRLASRRGRPRPPGERIVAAGPLAVGASPLALLRLHGCEMEYHPRLDREGYGVTDRSQPR